MSATYEMLKDLQNIIHVPETVEQIEIGTFNVATGEFVGLQTETTFPNANDPRPTRLVPNVTLHAMHADLVFRVINNFGADRVSIAAGVATIEDPLQPEDPTPQSRVSGNNNTWPEDTITLHIGRGNVVMWRLIAPRGGVRESRLNIIRADLGPLEGGGWSVGAGVFRIGALPVHIIYEPPQPPEPRLGANVQTLTVTQERATEAKLSFTSEGSITSPGTPQYESAVQARGILSTAASAIGALGNRVPGSGAIAGALNTFAAGLGSDEVESTQGRVRVRNGWITWRDKQEETYKTGLGLGPGWGDQFVYLRNVEFAWTAIVGNVPSGDRTLITMISAEIDYAAGGELINDFNELTGLTPVSSADGDPNIPTGSRTGLDTDSIRSLLDLNPFVTLTPTRLGVRFPTTWEAGRFQKLPPERIGNVPQDGIVRQVCNTKEEGEERVMTDYTIKTEDMQAGFLSFVGIGVEETKSIMAKTAISSSRLTHESETYCTTVSLSGGGEPYKFQRFADNVFRTFAFVPIPLAISGVLVDPSGRPFHNEIIMIKSGAITIEIKTDEEGRFWLFSDEIEQGPVALLSGTLRREVNFEGLSIRNLELRRQDYIWDVPRNDPL